MNVTEYIEKLKSYADKETSNQIWLKKQVFEFSTNIENIDLTTKVSVIDRISLEATDMGLSVNPTLDGDIPWLMDVMPI